MKARECIALTDAKQIEWKKITGVLISSLRSHVIILLDDEWYAVVMAQDMGSDEFPVLDFSADYDETQFDATALFNNSLMTQKEYEEKTARDEAAVRRVRYRLYALLKKEFEGVAPASGEMGAEGK